MLWNFKDFGPKNGYVDEVAFKHDLCLFIGYLRFFTHSVVITACDAELWKCSPHWV